MMHGYDKDAAVAFITRCIRKADHPELAEDIPALVPQMIDADMAYMHEAGVFGRRRLRRRRLLRG